MGAIQETCFFRKPTSTAAEHLQVFRNISAQDKPLSSDEEGYFSRFSQPSQLIFISLFDVRSVFLRDISQRGKRSHLAHEREQCCENKGQQSTTCSKSRGSTKAAKIEGTLEWRKQ